VPERETPAGEPPESRPGTGEPTAHDLDRPARPDIDLEARVRVRELRFREVPENETRFSGNTERESVAGTLRENLPYGVREGEEYRDAKVRLRIASRIVLEGPLAPGEPGAQSEAEGARDL
jgi:hypothetical protein